MCMCIYLLESTVSTVSILLVFKPLHKHLIGYAIMLIFNNNVASHAIMPGPLLRKSLCCQQSAKGGGGGIRIEHMVSLNTVKKKRDHTVPPLMFTQRNNPYCVLHSNLYFDILINNDDRLIYDSPTRHLRDDKKYIEAMQGLE